jgi:hypothetical protein
MYRATPKRIDGVLSVQTQDRLLDLLPATAGEVAIDADASEPGLLVRARERRKAVFLSTASWGKGAHGRGSWTDDWWTWTAGSSSSKGVCPQRRETGRKEGVEAHEAVPVLR